MHSHSPNTQCTHDHHHDNEVDHHDHSHGLGHHHHHGQGDIKIAFFLNLIFAVIELVGGYFTNSVAIMSDAIHDFGDASAIGLAWYLEKITNKKSDTTYSFGYKRFSILSAVITGLILILGSLFMLSEAIPRLINPQQPQSEGMIALAILGLFINGIAALKVSKHESLNHKMITLHLIEDVAGWAIVLVGAIIIYFFHIYIIDAILSMVLSIWVLLNAFKNLKEVVSIFLLKVPQKSDLKAIEKSICLFKEVLSLHHTHIWTIDGLTHMFSAHIVLKENLRADQIDDLKKQIKKQLLQYKISEATLEFEFDSTLCEDPIHE